MRWSVRGDAQVGAVTDLLPAVIYPSRRSDSEATARRKAAGWIGQYSDLPGARITLTDEVSGATLTDWPGVVGGPA